MNHVKYEGVYYPVRPISDLREMVNKSAELYKDRAAYLQKDRPGGTFQPISYQRFKEEMDAFGTKLLDLGLKGKKIIVVGESCYQWVLTYYAVVNGVGTIVPLDKNLPAGEMKSLVERSGASAIVYTKRMEKSLGPVFNESENLQFRIAIGPEDHSEQALSFSKLVQEGEVLLKEGIREYVDADIDADAMATLMFTSGTTGMAKGVMLSHKNIAANVYHMSKLVKVDKGDVVLSILPIHHAYEFTCSICTTFYQGGTVAICEGLKYIQKNMNEVKANIMLGVPLVFEKFYAGIWKQAEKQGQAEKLKKAIELSKKMKLYRNPMLMKKMFGSIHHNFGDSIKLFIAGGAAADPKVIEDFEAMGFPMIQGYGMSECAPIIAVNQDRYSKAASVGKPMPETEVKIISPDEDGVGEIACKSDSVMLGYYENEEETAKILKDGWLHTGDLGYLDQDGFLYITGRKKTVIVTKGGKNIYPEEVEAVLLENDLIQEVIVYGKEDERVGNVMVAADIFPNYKLLKEQQGDLNDSDIYRFYKDLVEEINKKMPAYKNVKRVSIRDKEFDKTTTGKIKRYGNVAADAPAEEKETAQEGYVQQKEAERKYAAARIKALKNSTDRYIRYPHQLRPVADLKEMLESSATMYPNHVAFMQKFDRNAPYTNITYKEVLADVNGLGTALINRNMKGKRISVIGETCYQWESSYLAVINGTGIVVPLDKELDPRDLKQQIIEAQVSAVFFNKKYEKVFKEIKDSGETNLEMLINLDAKEHTDEVLSWSKLIEEGKSQIAAGDRQFLDAEINGRELAALLFTSGTTGIAKAVMLSHYNMISVITGALSMIKLQPGEIMFSVLPVHHTYECTIGFLAPLYAGATVAYCQGLKYITRNLEEVQPHMMIGVPALIETLYKKIWQSIKKQGKDQMLSRLLMTTRVTRKLGIDISKPFTTEIRKLFGKNLRMIISGGAAIDPAILQFFNDLGIPAMQGYGLTECAPLTAVNPDVQKDMKLNSAGHLMPGMEVKIIDKDENGIGEICFKGDNVMLGYYNNPEATAEVIHEDWFHTGDLGYVDQDNFIFITGRKKNVIITKNGKNVYPEELEYHLNQIPYVDESMVWGDDTDGANDTSIIASVTIDEFEVTEALGEGYTDEEVEALIWDAVDQINETLPLF
ncbi:MAG: AMP-binding protein, partial [Firmicutes bacterium]|nr:AMP-binding protein [Bacillota bacterium]